MSQPDPEITARIDHLLRTDARLLAAAPLLGRVPAIVGEPKPARKPKARKARKLAPPRVGTQEAPSEVTFHAEDREALRDVAAALKGAEEAEDEQPAPTGAPWLKVAIAKRVSPEMRAALGGEALAMVKVDPDLWARLDSAGRDAALVLALRGLHHSERKSDGADLAGLDKPPLQCWPDTAPELSHLVAALTDDPAAAARDSDAAEALGTEVSIDLPEGEFVIKDPDNWHSMVSAAGLSSDAYLKWGEYAKVRLTVLPDGRISGRLLRRDGGSDEEIAYMTEAERRSMRDDEDGEA